MRDRKEVDPDGRGGGEDLGGVEGVIFSKRKKITSDTENLKLKDNFTKKDTNFKTETTNTKIWMRRD